MANLTHVLITVTVQKQISNMQQHYVMSNYLATPQSITNVFLNQSKIFLIFLWADYLAFFKKSLRSSTLFLGIL